MTGMNLHSTQVVLGALPGELRVAPARIEIRDGVIVRVEEGDPGPFDEILDDRIVAPAFVNAHTHLALHACRGLARPELLRGNLVEDLFFEVEKHLTAADVEAFARVAALECLLGGVGTVFDHYYHGTSTARAMRDCGLAGLVAPTLQDLAGPGEGLHEQALEETRELTAPEWARAGIHASVGPHATDTVSGELWRRALDLAGALDLVLHAHVAQSADETLRSIETRGCSPLQWLRREGLLDGPARQLFVHVLYESDENVLGLDPSRHVLGVCPHSQMQFAFVAPVSRWDAGGMEWFIGTDTGASNDRMSLQRELGTLFAIAGNAVVETAREQLSSRDLDARRIARLEAARKEAATSRLHDVPTLLYRAWGAPGRWAPALRVGEIAAGCRAQLIVVDPDHPAFWPASHPLRAFAYGDLSMALWGVVAGGEWVGEPGNPNLVLRDPRVQDWIVEATTRHLDLMHRAGIR
jgi:5-methylthioadenosine/S-adenosylhomocysteine deaminase